jgi:hypothetical protein
MEDERLEVLWAKHEISDAMLHYCRGIDRSDEQLIRSAYHEDAYDDHGFGGGHSGWEMAAAYGGEKSPYKAAQHFIGNMLIEVEGDSASSETYFVALHRFEHEGTDYDFIIAGRYVDQWERRGGPFKIARRTLVWDWMRTEPVATPWPGPDHDIPKAFWGELVLSTEGARFGQCSRGDFSYQVIKGL